MAELIAVHGDITEQRVDAIVNAANNAMRGGGGVDGAIHRAGGPDILRDCIERFPDGLATGDAGWTTAGRLPAQWVIHTVGPNHAAGQRDRTLLVSCYRRALEVADELGVHSIAFPLISAGIYGRRGSWRGMLRSSSGCGSLSRGAGDAGFETPLRGSSTSGGAPLLDQLTLSGADSVGAPT